MTKVQLRFIWFIILSAFTLMFYVSTIHARELHVSNPKSFLMERIPIFEGFSATRYCDGVTKGCILQGYGRCVTKRRTPSFISKSIADKWLQEDLRKCENHLDQHIPWWRDLSSVRQAALLDMTYNLGIDKLRTFDDFLHYMKNKNYHAASKRLSKSRWAKQVGIRSKEIRHAIEHNRWVAMKK